MPSPALIVFEGFSGLPSCFCAAVIRVVAVLHLCSWLISDLGATHRLIPLLKHQLDRFACCCSSVRCCCILLLRHTVAWLRSGTVQYQHLHSTKNDTTILVAHVAHATCVLLVVRKHCIECTDRLQLLQHHPTGGAIWARVLSCVLCNL